MGNAAKRQIIRLFSARVLGHKGPRKPFPQDEFHVMLFKRLSVLLAAPLLALGGCNTLESAGDQLAAGMGLADDAPRSYTSSEESEAARVGVVVSDEPLASRAGASVLSSQGNAVDAVSAMFFTLAATYPVAGGLGGGGICLVRNANGQVTEFDFLTRTPARSGAYAVPGAVRGIADMQRQFGALPWQRVVAPGEAYAATGFPISRALSTRLAAAQNVVRLDASLAAQFLDEAGQPKAVGTEVRNPALGQALSEIRLNGADGFYKGATGARIEAYSNAQGGAVTLDELATVISQQGAPRTRNAGDLTIYQPGARTGAGAFTTSLFDNLSRQRDLASAVRQSLAGFGVATLPGDFGSTGFSAVDASGQAATCAITLNGPFGSGRTATGTGVVLAASPLAQTGLASAFLAPMIAVRDGDVAIAATGAGGPNGAAAAVNAVLQMAGGRALGRRSDLRGAGTAPADAVNLISCNDDVCVALPDPGGHGVAAVADDGAN